MLAQEAEAEATLSQMFRSVFVELRQPEPGVWLWRSPHRRIYLVNATGTHALGDFEFAQTIWRAAASPSPPSQLTGRVPHLYAVDCHASLVLAGAGTRGQRR
jgi:hypothetical protein